MITKKTINGKDLITSCTIANCCLTVNLLETGELELTNEKKEKLICTVDELEEIFFYLQREGIASYSGNGT